MLRHCPSALHDFAERMFLTEDQPAWAPKLRSRTAALQTPKRHLCDPSLAAALLGANTDRLLAEPESLGFLFESQVVHDLRVYTQKIKRAGFFITVMRKAGMKSTRLWKQPMVRGSGVR